VESMAGPFVSGQTSRADDPRNHGLNTK